MSHTTFTGYEQRICRSRRKQFLLGKKSIFNRLPKKEEVLNSSGSFFHVCSLITQRRLDRLLNPDTGGK
ncbi:hypothetical protein B5X24_HaOG206315 [Helicoverpa armigera]|nr:hypothetical protein B5X24_HaOG206315 [Helicoverpa armigera]